MDYSVELGQARATQIVQSVLADRDGWRTDPDTGCWLRLRSLNSAGRGLVKRYTNAQIAVSGGAPLPRNAGKNFLLHRVSYLSNYGRDVTVGNVGSHLCDIPSCFNPLHVMDEPQASNLARKGCPGQVLCPDHPGHLILDLCNHQPKCIRPPYNNVNCCLTRFEAARQAGSKTPSPERSLATEVENSANAGSPCAPASDDSLVLPRPPSRMEWDDSESSAALESSDPIRVFGRHREVSGVSVAPEGSDEERGTVQSSPPIHHHRLRRQQPKSVKASESILASTQRTDPGSLPGAEFLDFDDVAGSESEEIEVPASSSSFGSSS